MANGIVHPDVFPDGSEPDSISWKQWNAPHVIYGVDGSVLSFGSIADGEFLKRDGDEIVGAPGGGGAVVVQRHRVEYADFTPLGVTGHGKTAPFFTIPAFAYIIAAAVVVVEAFDDSTAFDVGLVDFPGDTGVLTYRLIADGVTPEIGGFFHVLNNGSPVSYFDHITGGGVVTYTEQQLMAILDNFAEDGTTGIADMWIAYAVATEV